MTYRVLNKHKVKSITQIYSDVMKTIQCAHHSVCHEPISVLINVFMLLA